jgi:C-terminal processing protease CtpA/Prc
VLHQTGDAALKAAVEMAKAGKWPSAEARPKLALPPARFVEKPYTTDFYPNAEYRMLAAARVWGVFHYFHPYKHLYDEDWSEVLTEMLPKMARAENAREYHLAVAEMVAHVRDTHCFLGSAELAEFFGLATPPVELRWIEERPVVTRVFGDAGDVRPGDVVTKIDGEPYQKRMEALKLHIAASTPQSMMNRVMGALLRGNSGAAVRISVRRGGEAEREVSLKRIDTLRFNPYRQGEPFRLLTPKIGYVDLEKLTNAQVDAMFEMFRDTEAIVMDMRGYPQGTAWSVAPRLAEKQGMVAASFRRNLVKPDMSADTGIPSLTFEQRIPVTNKPRYAGKTVMLIDERAISQSEHSGLFYRAANGTKFIGSPTTGANGDVTFFTAPGGITINFSGHDVRWPDGKQLQRVGLTPDIEVRPTIAGVAAGRDEVLERAVAYLETGK